MMSNKALTTQKGTVNRGLIHLHLQKLLNMWLIFYKKKCLYNGQKFPIWGIFYSVPQNSQPQTQMFTHFADTLG